MADSIVFYGSYSNQNTNKTVPNDYNIPQAYFMTMATMYIVTFIVVSINAAQSYRYSYIEEVGLKPNRYAHKLFSSWNFSISSQKAAQLKHTQIYYEIAEVLAEFQSHKKRTGRWQTTCAWTMHATAHILVVCVLVLLGLGHWSLLQHMNDDKPHSKSKWSSMWETYMIIGVIVVMQRVFEWIAR